MTYAGAHGRLRSMWGSASQYLCVFCPNKASQWAYDGTDPSQAYRQISPNCPSWAYYSSWPEFYMPMCAGCHRKRDEAAAVAELREYREWKHRTGLTLADIGKELIGKSSKLG